MHQIEKKTLLKCSFVVFCKNVTAKGRKRKKKLLIEEVTDWEGKGGIERYRDLSKRREKEGMIEGVFYTEGSCKVRNKNS